MPRKSGRRQQAVEHLSSAGNPRAASDPSITSVLAARAEPINTGPPHSHSSAVSFLAESSGDPKGYEVRLSKLVN